jgi:general secretion pathway protein H
MIAGNMKCRGFTLLELLIVLVLMGIILSMAVLSVGDGGRGDRIRQEARRVVATFNLVSEEAVLNSQPYGVQLAQDGYRFLRYTNNEWKVVQDDSVLKARQFAPDIEVHLYIEGLDVVLPPSVAEKELKPHLVFYASAERTPFVLEILYTSSPSLRQRIEGPPVGKLKLEAPKEAV